VPQRRRSLRDGRPARDSSGFGAQLLDLAEHSPKAFVRLFAGLVRGRYEPRESAGRAGATTKMSCEASMSARILGGSSFGPEAVSPVAIKSRNPIVGSGLRLPHS
jgi:hypothetical protein